MIIPSATPHPPAAKPPPTRFQWRSRRSEMQFRNYLSLAYALQAVK